MGALVFIGDLCSVLCAVQPYNIDGLGFHHPKERRRRRSLCSFLESFGFQDWKEKVDGDEQFLFESKYILVRKIF